MEKRRRSSRGAELPSVRSDRAAEVQKSGEQVCLLLLLLLLLLLVDTWENMTTLVQLVLQELVLGPFCPATARLALFSNSGSSAGAGGQEALSSSRELCPSRSERNVSIGGSARRRRGKGRKQCSGAEA